MLLHIGHADHNSSLAGQGARVVVHTVAVMKRRKWQVCVTHIVDSSSTAYERGERSAARCAGLQLLAVTSCCCRRPALVHACV